MTTLQTQAEQIVGQAIDWSNDHEGYLTCPGQDLHQNRNARTDTIIYVDGAPNVYCYHTSCSQVIADLSRRLQRELRGDSSTAGLTIRGHPVTGVTGRPPMFHAPRDRSEFLSRKRRETQIAATFRGLLVKIIDDCKWPLDALRGVSPMAPDDLKEDWMMFLGLFEGQEGLVWCGNVTDSGRPEHSINFQTVDRWTTESSPRGNFTCPSLFNPGTTSRSNANVLSRPYLVLESDTLPKDSMCAVFRWLQEACFWPLRAVIDTGGKSLHGWFDMPPQTWLPDLRVAFEALQLDPAMFKASQPVRVPGAFRADKDKYQRLIYYAPPTQPR